MQLPPSTVINEVLLENVLAMIVCILTKIPVFIIGAPRPSISFVDIGNWKLDISNSSRALLAQRPKFGIDDRVDIVVRLVDFKLLNFIMCALLRPLAKAYSEYKEHERNFGGTDQNENPRREYFDTVLKTFNNCQNWTYNPIPTLILIKANLNNKATRHHMVIGKSDLIVTILTYQLIEKGLDPMIILGLQF
ncbi:hypothetical protein C2G38_2317437 [Gigaspora rosea]|uniref:Uncharacterized protein n=1 Tax=Gigaspora rosea TaxID=44941 RepID=A0A397W7J5_9GLOM|nr:hypothetical protein C2G38_2317437 [Gigaspora rosea]